jgi:peptidoglycan/xylan/chitin deacetylase (PgdA/CDA1 family)
VIDGTRSGAVARLTPAARAAVKGAAATLDLVRRPAPGIAILIFHQVGAGTGAQMDLDPGVFADQLSWLAATRRVIGLDDALVELADPQGPPRPGVVVTFDDGTPDWLDHVLPALDRARVPATFYVATRFVDEQAELPGGGRPISWAALADLASSDLVSVGSHTHGHLLLDRLDSDAVQDDLDRSIDLLGAHLGRAPEHFAYPKAVAGSGPAESAVRARFRSAALAGTRANGAGQDPHRLRRSPVQRADAMRWFRHKADGGLVLEDDLRRGVNRLRYRGRST